MNLKKITIQGRYLEFMPALYNIMWGLWILSPWWNSFDSSAIFNMMKSLAPEWLWGLVVTSIGSFQMAFLFTNRIKVRALAALMSMFTLFSMAVLVACSNYKSTAMVAYMVVAIGSWLAYTEILEDIKEKQS